MAGQRKRLNSGWWLCTHLPPVVLLAVGLLWVSPVLAQETSGSGARRLNLTDVLRLAREQNPTLLTAREQLKSAEAGVWSAAGRMLPSVRISTLWNFAEKVQVLENPFPFPGAPTEFELDFTKDYQGSVNLALPIWAWGANRAAYQDARTAVDVARSSNESSRQEVALQVTQTFYGVLLAEQGRQVARDALAQAERQAELAAQRVAQGAASEFDLLRARVQVANLRPGVSRAEAMLRQVRIGLNLLLGLSPEERLELTGELSYSPVQFDLEDLKREAVAGRAELHSARLATQRAGLAVSMARSTRLPTLAISGIYSFRSDNVGLSRGFDDSYVANLVLSIPLFDGFAARSRTAQARAGQQQARIMLDQTRRAIEAEVEQAFHDLRAAEQSHLAQIDNVAQAERALEIAQVSYENEMMTSVELMDSQLALTIARQNRYQSLYDYQVALARIEKAVGRPIGN